MSMDPLTSAVAVHIGEALVGRYLLDPTFTKVEQVVGDLTRRALAKLGNEPPVINRRTGQKILDEVVATDDEAVIEYLSGVLAASEENDSGTAAVAQISRLSSQDLRLHWLIYEAIWRMAPNNGRIVSATDNRSIGSSYQIFLPGDELHKALALTNSTDSVRSITCSMRNLVREGLISTTPIRSGITYQTEEEGFSYDSQMNLRRYLGGNSDVPSEGLIATPTIQGISLFRWAVGLNGEDGSILFESKYLEEQAFDNQLPRCPSSSFVADWANR